MTKDLAIRSPVAKVGGLFYFGRTAGQDKRPRQRRAAGRLSAESRQRVRRARDEIPGRRLRRSRRARKTRRRATTRFCNGASSKGRKPSDEEIYIWNEFMRKYGWNDKASEILDPAQEGIRHGRSLRDRNDVCLHRCRRRPQRIAAAAIKLNSGIAVTLVTVTDLVRRRRRLHPVFDHSPHNRRSLRQRSESR